MDTFLYKAWCAYYVAVENYDRGLPHCDFAGLGWARVDPDFTLHSLNRARILYQETINNLTFYGYSREEIDESRQIVNKWSLMNQAEYIGAKLLPLNKGTIAQFILGEI